MNKEQILELAKEVKAIYRGYRDNVTFSFTGNQLEKFAELLQQKQSDRIAELEASIKSVEADKARLLEALKEAIDTTYSDMLYDQWKKLIEEMEVKS